jgi:hypothetical protein
MAKIHENFSVFWIKPRNEDILRNLEENKVPFQQTQGELH